MGLLIDTDVLILADRGKTALDLWRFADEGMAYISTITASELLIGVHRAQDPALRHGFAVLTRNAKDFRKLSGVRVLEFTLPV